MAGRQDKSWGGVLVFPLLDTRGPRTRNVHGTMNEALSALASAKGETQQPFESPIVTDDAAKFSARLGEGRSKGCSRCSEMDVGR
jgi:hypothetical protein